MFTRLIIALSATLCASVAYAQSVPSNTVTLSGPTGADCPEIVAGQINMPDIIEQAGGAEKLYELSQAQLAEYDRWFGEMEAVRGQGVREAEIEALIAQGRTAQEVELQISEAVTAADWLVFFLDEDITTDVMPDGHRRGFLQYSSNRESFDTGQLYLIGMHRDLGDGIVVHYQRCDYANLANLSVQHVCDTLPGTSGSMLLSMEDGELRFRAMHSSGRFNGPEGAADRHIFDHVPQDRSQWNSATPALRVFEAQDPESQRLP